MKMTVKQEIGSTVVEVALTIGLLLFVFIIGANVLFFARYSSSAHWLASLAARVGSVTKPNDQAGPAPMPSQLKVPNSPASAPYLVYYQQAASGCNGAALSERHLRTINLILGEYQRIFQNKAKTVSTWTNSATVGTLPEPGELYIVPANCTNDPNNAEFTQWKVCVRVPQLLLGNPLICHKASSDVQGI